MISFSQEAHDIPPKGFLVNMASSSFSWACPDLDKNTSYKFFNYLSSSLRAFLVSFLSASYFVRALTISLILSIIIFSRLFNVS